VVTFEALASLLLPSDPGRRGAVIEAGPSWDSEFDPDSLAADVVVWGRGSFRSGSGLAASLRFATARRRAIRHLIEEPPAGFTVASIHGLPPPLLRPSLIRSRARAGLLTGAAVRLRQRDAGPSVLEEAASAAGAATVPKEFHPGAGGSALVRLSLDAGGTGILRVGRAGTEADPTHSSLALQRLSGEPLVPVLLGNSFVTRAAWSLESMLPGRRPRRLTPSLVTQVAEFCAALPKAEGPPTAHRGDLELFASLLPRWEPAFSAMGERLEQGLGELPAAMRHGDLWVGNLLATGDVLTGILDWDAWQPAAAPGVDLLHLVATEMGQRARRPLGRMWLERPWLSDAFKKAGADYWRSLGIRPTPAQLDAIGVAWWVGRAANSLRRAPELAEDAEWVSDNVETVLGSL
jgi:hypothetical protein